jgi:hypothetical protein
VTVDLASTDTEAVVRVRDNGRGIAGSLLPYVFDRFKQGEGESSRSRAGLGLGLAIVREMVVRDTIKLVVCLPCKPWLTASLATSGSARRVARRTEPRPLSRWRIRLPAPGRSGVHPIASLPRRGSQQTGFSIPAPNRGRKAHLS